MSASLVRIAMLAYPRHWRRRYGLELEELTMFVLADPITPYQRFTILADLVYRGLDERVRQSESRAVRGLMTTAAAGIAVLCVLCGGLVSDGPYDRPNAQMAVGSRIGTGVEFTRDSHSSADPKHGMVAVYVPPNNTAPVAVAGHSAVRIDVRSNRIISIERAHDKKHRRA